MTAVELMAVLVEHGVLLESARGPLPNVAELVAGEPIRGSWWGHRSSHAIFHALNDLADSPDVVRTRLVNGKVTLIHRRLWPALVRLADRLPRERLTAIHEEHTSSGHTQSPRAAVPGVGARRRGGKCTQSLRARGGEPAPILRGNPPDPHRRRRMNSERQVSPTGGHAVHP